MAPETMSRSGAGRGRIECVYAAQKNPVWLTTPDRIGQTKHTLLSSGTTVLIQ